MVSAMLWALSWEQIFDDPIELPDGRLLRTLADAVEFIQELPKATHDRSEWQAAIEALRPCCWSSTTTVTRCLPTSASSEP
jgi:hypothetical protein